MADNGIQRQLKAIFSADVKGYSQRKNLRVYMTILPLKDPALSR
jgi:hypothetical protein